jgi:putative membrane protein
MRRHILTAASAFALLTAPAAAQVSAVDGAPPTVGQSVDLVNLDASSFAALAASTNTLEITASETAAEMAEDAEVKAFALKMIKHHKMVTAELAAAARAAGVSLDGATTPVQMDPAHARMLDQMKVEGGSSFDDRYMALQVEAHENAIDLFETYAENGENDDLKAFADEALPALREHLQQAQALARPS